jgi:hypothetical protein
VTNGFPVTPLALPIPYEGLRSAEMNNRRIAERTVVNENLWSSVSSHIKILRGRSIRATLWKVEWIFVLTQPWAGVLLSGSSYDR